MRAVTTISGTMAPLARGSVDTDQIIPKQFLKRIERTGYGPFLFYDWARQGDGEPDPEFPLNKPEHAAASVLVTGPSFGIGSSREHAVWAIQDHGFEAVVAASFGDIFRNNSYNNGLLAVELTTPEVDHLLATAAATPQATITIDLEAQTVVAPGLEARFAIAASVKQRLLDGLDDIALTLQRDAAIATYEERRPGWMPTVTQQH
jgi:3-isopropylmalate/(R)-2-methylmalate dehydratase small subunit